MIARAFHAALRVPFWLWPWCGFLFLLPMKQVVPGPPVIALELFGAIAIALAGLPSVRQGRVRRLCLTVLMLCLIASYFFSIEPAMTLMPLWRIAIAFTAYMLIGGVRLRGEDFETTLRAWLWGGVCAAMLLVALGERTEGDERAVLDFGGVGTDPNYMVVELLMPTAIAVYFLCRPQRRLEGLVCLLPLVYAAYTTQSRGGLLSMLALVFVALVLCGHKRIAGFSFAALGIAYAIAAPFLGRLNLAEDPTGSHRTSIWHVLLPKAYECWPTGIGLDATKAFTRAASGLYWGIQPHNTYIQAFVETGLFGLLALLATMLVHFLVRGPHPVVPFMRAGLAAIMVSGLFLHLLAYQLLWIPWVITAQAACLAAPSRPRRSVRPPSPPRALRRLPAPTAALHPWKEVR